MAVTSSLTVVTSTALDVTIEGADVYVSGQRITQWPDRINADKTYLVTSGALRISLKRNGIELATDNGKPNTQLKMPDNAGKIIGPVPIGDGALPVIGAVPDGWAYGTTRNAVLYGGINAPGQASDPYAIGVLWIEVDDLENPTTATMYINNGTVVRDHNTPDKTVAVWEETPAVFHFGADPPEDGVTAGDTGDYYIATGQSGLTVGDIWICTDGAADTWTNVTVGNEAGLQRGDPVTEIEQGGLGLGPFGFGPGSQLVWINDDPEDGGQLYYNAGTADAPKWVTASQPYGFQD